MMIKVSGLSKSFDKKRVLNNVTFEIEEGEMIGLIGASGSGKSTLLNILGGLEPFSKGTVKVGGFSLGTMNPKKRLLFLRNIVSFLFQTYALMEDKSVNDNITINSKFHPVSDSLIRDTLRKVGLEGYQSRIVNTLSGGEQQRVALARILIKPSIVILADEPTGNLDEKNAKIVWQMLRSIADDGKTVLVASHDLSHLDLFDRIIEL